MTQDEQLRDAYLIVHRPRPPEPESRPDPFSEALAQLAKVRQENPGEFFELIRGGEVVDEKTGLPDKARTLEVLREAADMRATSLRRYADGLPGLPSGDGQAADPLR